MSSLVQQPILPFLDKNIVELRIKLGECPLCGTPLFDVDTVTNERKPLTIEGIVLVGRCLYCYPSKKQGDVSHQQQQQQQQQQQLAFQNYSSVKNEPKQSDDVTSNNMQQQHQLSIRKAEPSDTMTNVDNCIVIDDSDDDDNEDYTIDDRKPAAIKKAAVFVTPPRSHCIHDNSKNDDDDNNNNSIDDDSIVNDNNINDDTTVNNNNIDEDDTMVNNNNKNKSNSINSKQKLVVSQRLIEKKQKLTIKKPITVIHNKKKQIKKKYIGNKTTTSGTKIQSNQMKVNRKVMITDNTMITILDHCNREYIGTLLSGTIKKGVVDVHAPSSSVSESSSSSLLSSMNQNNNNDNSNNQPYMFTYYGEVKDGLFHGKGKHTNQFGTISDGTFFKGAMHGFGTCYWTNGWIYEGEWYMDTRQGHGKQYHKSHRNMTTKKHTATTSSNSGTSTTRRRYKNKIKYEMYEGEWRNDMWHGSGKLLLAGDGDVYNGEFKNDLMDGYGIYTFADKTTIYTGQFKDNVRSGVGKQVFSNGSIYEGEWDNNWHKGQGTLTLLDGTKYQGKFFKNGKFEGNLQLPDGTIKETTVMVPFNV